MKRWGPVLGGVATLLLISSCMKMDGFFWDYIQVESLEDYQNLPASLAEVPADWVQTAAIEREVYLHSPGGEPLEADALEGQTDYIHGAFLPAPVGCPVEECPLTGTGVTILYQHGNNDHIYYFWHRALILWSLGVNVFIYDFRGWGLSRGEISPENINMDTESAMSWLLTREDVDPSLIVAYGWSMGGPPTSYLAGVSPLKDQLAGAILEAPLDTPSSLVQTSLGMDVPGEFFVDMANWNGPEYLKTSRVPVLHMHGQRDTMVKFASSENYYQVLADGTHDYTHYLGKTDAPDEEWVARADHRNIPFPSLQLPLALPNFMNDEDNPGHCCLHPEEFLEDMNQAWLSDVAGTTGEQVTEDLVKYRALLAGWVEAHVLTGTAELGVGGVQ